MDSVLICTWSAETNVLRGAALSQLVVAARELAAALHAWAMAMGHGPSPARGRRLQKKEKSIHKLTALEVPLGGNPVGDVDLDPIQLLRQRQLRPQARHGRDVVVVPVVAQ